MDRELSIVNKAKQSLSKRVPLEGIYTIWDLKTGLYINRFLLGSHNLLLMILGVVLIFNTRLATKSYYPHVLYTYIRIVPRYPFTQF